MGYRSRQRTVWLPALAAVVLLLSGVVPARSQYCAGDCDGSGAVTVTNLVTLVNIALSSAPLSACSRGDTDGSGDITIDEIIAAVNSALSLCVAAPTPTPTVSPTPTTVPGLYWEPGISYPSVPEPGPRGLIDRRGLIHAHSVYSHDACDGTPVVNGVRDPVCFEDFRRGLCQSRHDFVMLTDHNTSFSEYEYPDVLLYREDHGDALVMRNTKPVASWAGCPDGSHALILAGTESGTMPVGLEEQVADAAERSDIYNAVTADAINAFKAKGAVSLVAHTEGWSVEQLEDLPLDGFEMYNVHANLLLNVGKAAQLLLRINDPGLMRPDLILLGIISEDPRYLTRWGSVLASGIKRVTTMATDCHRNTFTQLMQDGERVDSFRRMMMWFSNHLLVRPQAGGSWDDRDLKDALRAGRLYGAFEVMGYPLGFDYHARVGTQTFEMGEEVQLADGPVLLVSPPTVRNLDPSRQPPALTLRILRAVPNGFEVVASGPDALAFTPTEPGAYRAEVRMVPLHLRPDLRNDAATVLAKDYVWIYGNAIYVR
jgi:hypothetical protein